MTLGNGIHRTDIKDPRLWLSLGDDSIAYLDGRGVSTPGTFRIYIPSDDVSYVASLVEVSRCSVESSYWLHGLLAGAALPFWFGESFTPDIRSIKLPAGWLIEEDPRMQLYYEAQNRFEKTGMWRVFQDECCPECGQPYFPQSSEEGRHLPSDPEEFCWSISPDDTLDEFWPDVVDSVTPA